MEVRHGESSRTCYQFGPFRLDPSQRRLVRDGVEVRLSPKVFETLVLLVQRHGLLVEKDELMSSLWPGTFVEEVTLARNISLLRKALGDVSGQEESQYIETVSKRGYRFIADVEVSPVMAAKPKPVRTEGSTETEGQREWWRGNGTLTRLSQLSLFRGRSRSATISGPSRGFRLLQIAAAALIAIVLGAVVIVSFSFFKKVSPEAMAVRSTIQPPPGHRFAAVGYDAEAPALSPDGKLLVASVRNSLGNHSLWLRRLDDINGGRILETTNDGRQPFWSPDSRSLGFFAEGKLKRIDIDGGPSQVLCDASYPSGGTWGEGGVILLTPNWRSGIYQIAANGGTPTQVTEPDTAHGEFAHIEPVFLSDGRHFLFLMISEQPGLYVGSLDSKENHLLVRTIQGPAFVADGKLLYVRDGAVVAQPFDERKLITFGPPVILRDQVGVNPVIARASFSVSRTGVLIYYPVPAGGPYALLWYSRNGRRSTPIGTGFFSGPVISPDGSQAIVTIPKTDSLGNDLWGFDLTRGTHTRLTSLPGLNWSPVWNSNGTSVLFASTAKGPHQNIYRIKSDGTGKVETVLDSYDSDKSPWSVCRNAGYLAYHQIIKGAANSIWILPLVGDPKPFPLVQSHFSNSRPAFSPDCKWVAYVSNESGQPEIYITRFPDASHRYRVSTQGGGSPAWRGDGKELFYFSGSNSSLMAVKVDEATDGLSLESPRPLLHVENENVSMIGRSFDVTPDGQRFLITEANSPSGDVPLTVVTNWNAELQQK